MNPGSSSHPSFPPKGSKIRLTGLRNHTLNGQIGTITNYTRDRERVIIALEGPRGLIKVKPKQIEVIDESLGGDHPGSYRRNSSEKRLRGSMQGSMRSSSRDNRNGPQQLVVGMDINVSRSNGNVSVSRSNGTRHRNGAHVSHTNTRRVSSTQKLRDSATSQASNGNTPHASQEVIDTFRSADAMFEIADTDDDGVISQSEFEVYMKNHSDHNMQMIRECFSMIDANNNGEISRDEVRSAFLKTRTEMMGGTSTDHNKNLQEELLEVSRDAFALFDQVDFDRNGGLSIREFELYMKRNTSHSDRAIHIFFGSIDADKNCTITRDEVQKAYLQNTKNLDDELIEVSRDADILFDKVDFDKNGGLSIREFELYMKRSTPHSDHSIHVFFGSIDIDKNSIITRAEFQRAYLLKTKRSERPTLMEILGLEEEEMGDIEDDVYNMFFLSEPCGQSFWFAILVFVLKLGLIVIVAKDLYNTGIFPDKSDVPIMVKTTQFLLLPMNISVQEELIATFFIYANLKWTKGILELNPGATKGKYHAANLIRFLDGLAFLFVNTILLLQSTQAIGAFMNLTALEFLSSIDNVALQLARDGYLSESLEKVAGDVQVMKLPKNHNHGLQYLDSVMLMLMCLGQLGAWIFYMF